jgi:cyclopropane fatty-acyl-phospholipid synthase-like methyltransferase
MQMNKPFSQACENNKDPILTVLKTCFSNSKHVLEVGSGTGQHSVHFAMHLAHLEWQTSDRLINHGGIQQWIDEAQLSNLHAPLTLDLNHVWPITSVDAIYTANTLHIISRALVECFFDGIKRHLAPEGVVCIYGPFKYQGQYTSESNQRFDEFLKGQDSESGIRDFEYIVTLGELAGLTLLEDHKMPANNQLLVFKRHA